MAIASLVASIAAVPMSFFCFVVGGLLAAIVGIVLGIIALNQTRQSGEGGRGFAVAGIALGGVVVVLALIVLIIVAVGSRNYPSY
jgi:ABC-type dipeptide/oligopeptide/nickel transport system permease component